MSGILLGLQFVLGGVAIFSFFGAMFNGLTRLMVIAAAAGLTANFVLSAVAARKGFIHGVIGASAFAAPALLFAGLSLGDLAAQGDAEPFLFWSLAALGAAGSGLIGALLASLACRPGK